MEEQVLTPLALSHLLQHTLRSLCIHENSQWVYAVFWRILPRNYPPPKWDSQGSAYDRSRGNRRNWILAWEDGFCNFAASTAAEVGGGGDSGGGGGGSSSSSIYATSEYQQYQGLQPELFFKMSHEIYNYGEGLIGKVAADHGHKWIHREPNHDHNQEINFLSSWQNSADQQPRTWEAQFQSGIKTIALIAVREGVVQLGAVHKVVEDLSYVVLLRKKFSYIESIPGVLLDHPSSYPFKNDHNYNALPPDHHQQPWHYQSNHLSGLPQPPELLYDQFNQPVPMKITPSMSSLEALLAKLPSVMPMPPGSAAAGYCEEQQAMYMSRPMELMSMEKVAKEEVDDDEDGYGNDKDLGGGGGGGDSGSSMSSYPHHHHHSQHYNYYPDLKM